jgi:hypothetical protein
VRRPVPRLLALALAGATIAAGARALGQSSQGASAGAPGDVPPSVSLDSVIAEPIEKLGGPTWQPLTALARDVRAALTGNAPEQARAGIDAAFHGDPSMGCFVLALRMGSGSAAMHDALREALSRPGKDAPAWTLRDWNTAPVPAPASVPAGAPPALIGTHSTFAFTGEALQGEVRVLSRGTKPPADTLAVACFYNEREPARSARLCQRMLPALEAALATIPAPRPATTPETSP